MSFCQDVKRELCKLEEKKMCGEMAELYGMLVFSKSFPREAQIFTTENKFFAEFFSQKLAGVTGVFVTVRTDPRHLKEDTPMYTVSVEDPYQRETLRTHFSLGEPTLHPSFTEKNGCLFSFFRGLFLLCGSMTNPEREYHLELTAPNPMLAEEAFLLAESANIHFKRTRRKNNEILYIKGSEQIEDFLTMIGSSKFALKLMDIKVMKNVRNKVNRMTNCETANLDKTVLASNIQVQDILYVKNRCGLSYFDEDLRELAALRLEYPELSLRELSELLSAPLSRSGVNHRFKRIAEAADKLRLQIK